MKVTKKQWLEVCYLLLAVDWSHCVCFRDRRTDSTQGTGEVRGQENQGEGKEGQRWEWGTRGGIRMFNGAIKAIKAVKANASAA